MPWNFSASLKRALSGTMQVTTFTTLQIIMESPHSGGTPARPVHQYAIVVAPPGKFPQNGPQQLNNIDSPGSHVIAGVVKLFEPLMLDFTECWRILSFIGMS